MSFYTNASLVRNGNAVIDVKALTTAQLVNQQGWQDASTLHTWYKEDPLKNHLKLMSFFGQQEMQKTSLFQDVIKHDAILEVNGWEGKFTYDYPVETDNRLKTVEDYSYQKFPGMDGTTFKVAFNREFAPGTTLTPNGMDGDALAISDASPVRDLGYGFEHTAVLLTNDPNKTYPSEYLQNDIEYFEIGHGIAEWGEKLGNMQMSGKTTYMTNEFMLGAPMGYETFFSAKANSIDLKMGTSESLEYIDQLEDFYKNEQEIIVLRDKSPNATHKFTVGTILEMLTIKKFDRQMSIAQIFQRGGTLKSQKGTIRYNEGLWHQMRRGYIITYAKRNGLTKEHIKQAKDYVFKANPYKDTVSCMLKFKCGSEVFNNVLEIFKVEVQLQISNLAALLGADRLLPENPVFGGDLYNLGIKPVRFTKVTLPGIGMVELEEDFSMNFSGVTDRNLRGMNPNNGDYTSYSMIIWDASNQDYSNSQAMPKGTKMVGDNSKANIYLVTPKDEKIYWGRENGRYSMERASDIVASAKTMHSSFFIYGFGALWMKDPSKFVMIELEEKARKAYK